MKILNLFLLILFTHQLLPAKGIKGVVIDDDTKKPLEYAHIILYENDKPVKEAVSDLNGAFIIETVKEGKYQIHINSLGYDPYIKQVVVSNTMEDLRTIPMKMLEIGLGEVEVVVNKKQVIYKLDRRVIEASSSLLSAGGSAVNILENTPSIRVNAEGEVTFRGSSGFTVYIDGKPSVFSGTQALEQIPAGQIENIEIITTPSAKHDTQGDIGIINVITKKHFDSGLSGFVNVNGSTLKSRGIDLLLTQQNKASRWYFGGSAVNQRRKSHFKQEKTTVVNDTMTVSSSDGPRESTWYMYTLKGGWSYSTPRTTYALDLEGGYGGLKREGDLDYTETLSESGQRISDGKFFSRDNYDIHETFYQGNVSVKHKFNDEGHFINGRFYLKYGGDALEYFESNLYNSNNEREQGHRAWEDEHRWTVRGNLDYEFPYSKTGQLKAGYQYFSYIEDGDYKMKYWNPEIKDFYWRDDIYNVFFFQQEINSVYAIVSERYRAFEFQAGVRGEHTRQVLESSEEWANRLQKRFELFPSVHAGLNLPNNQKLLLAYSRRTNRPELYFMEPYITYRDYYSAEIGNPDIRPEYINSYELNYAWNKEDKSLSATAFYRNRTDKIERLRVPYMAGVTLDSMANVGHDYSAGAELTLSWQALKWWNAQMNGSLYYYKVENEYRTAGKDETSTNYEISLYNTFDMGKTTRIQLDGNFVGPSVTTQGRTDSFWYINLALRQQFLKRKLTGTLAFRDVFNTARYVSNITTPSLKSYTRIRPEYPLITLSLSYTFNQYKLSGRDSGGSHNLFEGTTH